ncbi:RNA-binding S4 domain-containing protein [Streptobacillus moniliformis]|uniref:RNA-binding S4 domain protein n=1 Tax=Streptobacillus moniliformis (strain ATCC 14647 / DSM 12112 / NCTC 10651 / 9901) TaxID=519441 RepID=D1AW62_STRM9|nr:RNA-binding S4 domain-containing protein [Streptobacillus moniliformis]ACZ00538.1 RNA-binding S4 domain protein [Streptobacillus moniliformis DSM 12112]AVL43044.1 RNA-binding S4 domain-containing protein [Streptobacillus moniliformis]QXW65306.1 RNA-binding S4 domain-containing protein [Streptobacillus moniliformis]SQA12815.1 ribosome-associated protein [Streptobacillus moniliformis]
MEIKINTEYIKLDQLLKYANLVENGSSAKEMILEGRVLVDNEVEVRRGRKIYRGMIVEFEGERVEVK